MSHDVSRRSFLTRGAAVVASLVASRSRTGAQAKTPLLVYKDASCGCCHQWVEYMKANGFDATVKDTSDLNGIKRARKIPEPLWSCHTAHVEGYLIEGHVPAADVRRLLAQKPKNIVGLTIPGMPASAPGMDLKPFKPYTVLAFDAQGKTTVWAAHTRA